MIVGAALQGRVLVIDDVISAGTSVRESIDLIRAAGATPAGIAIALDRQERGRGELSAVQEVQGEFGVPCIAIAGLDDLLSYLQAHKNQPGLEGADLKALQEYREQYGT